MSTKAVDVPTLGDFHVLVELGYDEVGVWLTVLTRHENGRERRYVTWPVGDVEARRLATTLRWAADASTHNRAAGRGFRR